MAKPKKLQYNGDSKVIKYLATCVNWLLDNGSGSQVEVTPIQTTGTKIAEIDVNGDVSELYAPQGGTSVEANPTGTPTDELNTIRIGQDIYEIVGGGGGSGSGYSKTNLWRGEQVTTAELQLSESISNFDIIEFVGGLVTTGDKSHVSFTYDAKQFLRDFPYVANPTAAVPHFLACVWDDALFRAISGSSDDKIYVWDLSGHPNPEKIYEINGIKFGSGDGYASTLLWDYVTDNSNVIPYDVFTATLHDNINNYNQVIVELVSHVGDLSIPEWNSTVLVTIDVNAINNSHNPGYFSYTTYEQRSSRFYLHNNVLQKTTNNQSDTNGIVRVYGIKFSQSGGGSSLPFEIVINSQDNGIDIIYDGGE